MSLTTYRATDRRCYYGAPCSDLQREWDHTEALEARMKKADPKAWITYFPVEGTYSVATWAGPDEVYRNISTKMHSDKQVALIEAIKILEVT